MKRMWTWFVFGVFIALGILMIAFGIIFIKDMYYSSGEAIFGTLIIGVVLILAGGGILSSTVAETVRKLWKKEY